MSKVKEIFKKLSPYHHFLVFLIILTVLKIVNVFITEGFDAGIHFAGLGVGLIVISTVLHFVFSLSFDSNKKYLNSLISTFLIILMLSHADPEPVRGVLVILLLYVSKFFVKYKGQNIFNPVIFTIGAITILSLFVPFLGVPPMDFTGIDIRFPIFGQQVPLTLLPITLALVFNIRRIKKFPLTLSFILTALVFGFFTQGFEFNLVSYLIMVAFVGVAVIIEPKTSPIKVKEQIFYGVIAAFVMVVFSFLKVPNPLAITLLLGNVGFFLYRQNLMKNNAV